jgi:hypothetical protein
MGFLMSIHPLLHHSPDLVFCFLSKESKKEMKFERDTISYHPKHSKECK